MKLSCCQWGLDEGVGPLRYWHRFLKNENLGSPKPIGALANLGFQFVDICPTMQTTSDAKSSLQVHGCLLPFPFHEAPPESSFDSEDEDRVAPVENHTSQGIEHAAKLGAEYAYVVPPKHKDQDTLPILSQRYRHWRARTKTRTQDSHRALPGYGPTHGQDPP